MEIKYIMNTTFNDCIESDSLRKISMTLAENDNDFVIAVDKRSVPIGIITQADIDEIYSNCNVADFQLVASDIIKHKHKDNVVCWEEDDIGIGLSIINDRKLSVLPIVNNIFHLVGVMDKSDALCNINNIISFQAHTSR